MKEEEIKNKSKSVFSLSKPFKRVNLLNIQRVVIVSIILCTTAFPAFARADSKTTIIKLWIGNSYMDVGGIRQPIDAQGTKPIIVESRTLVPIRAVIEAFGGEVAWDSTTQKVTINFNNNTLELWIGRSTASLNGYSVQIDSTNSKVVPMIINGRTMVPLRFVAESFGIDVQYDATSKMITLTYVSYTAPVVQLPSAPTLTSPATNSTLNNSNITFTWTAISGVDYYKFQITNNGLVVQSNSSISVNSYILTGVTLADGTYSWQVAAHNSAGWSSWSTPFAFILSTPLPDITLNPGNFYFSVDGKVRFIFSRNIAGFFYEDFGNWMDWAQYNGDRVLRIYLSDFLLGGYGYTNTGELNEKWAQNWDAFLTQAEAHGLYVLPYFSGWFDWNGAGITSWPSNPFNPANGGPANNRIDIFQENSPAQVLYLQWVAKVVTRFQSHKNIFAWEVLDEGNLIYGITEQQGIAFTEHMAQVIRAADPNHRPITASLADVGTWPNFYKSNAIDLIQVHPYPLSAELDRFVIDEVHHELAVYNKPVLIGESGLNADSPLNYPSNAEVGIRHAIWAGVVSGAANGRALWWEDSYGIFFKELRSLWVNKYADAELPAVRFTNGVDFTGFKPLTVQYQNDTKIWGAAIGNESMVLGWIRDASSEPSDWKLLPSIQGQTVTILVPGSAQDWQVDFYDTKTGYALSGSVLLTRQGNYVTVALPDFTDDIAFKLFVNTSGSILPPPTPAPEPTVFAPTNTDSLAGQWVGTVFQVNGDWAAVLHVTIQPGCKVESVCGKSAFDWCSIDLVLKEIDGDTFVFDEQDVSATSTCAAGGIDHIRLQPDGTLLLQFDVGTSGFFDYSGILHRP
jgi:hypothetical protein